jgi:hypothetical protein
VRIVTAPSCDADHNGLPKRPTLGPQQPAVRTSDYNGRGYPSHLLTPLEGLLIGAGQGTRVIPSQFRQRPDSAVQALRQACRTCG